MNTKIIIIVLLSIVTHNSVCMIISHEQTKKVKNIYEAQQPLKKAAEEYLKPFMERSIVENSQIFSEQRSKVKNAIICQCIENNDTSPIIGLIQLPTIDQFKVISYWFEDNCTKATEYFISIPLKHALEKDKDLPNNNLTLLNPKAKLSQSIIFRLTQEEQRILTKIYTEDLMAINELKPLVKLPKDILQIILQQNLTVTIPKNENLLLLWLTTPCYAPKSMPMLERIKLIGFTSVWVNSPIVPLAMIYGKSMIKPFMTVLGISIPLTQLFIAYPLTEYGHWSTYYNTEATATILVPLESLL